MSKIKRELQHAKWEYDFDTNELIISVLDMNPDGPEGTTVVINKAYSYSLGRFLVRVWQKLASKQKRKKKVVPGENISVANISK